MIRSRKPQKVEENTFSDANIVTGIHLITILLYLDRVKEVWVREGSRGSRLNNLISEVQRRGVMFVEQSPEKFDARIKQGSNHQGVLALARLREIQPENNIPVILGELKNPLILVLDGVTDPHNFGACLRSAEAFGASCVIVPKDNSAPMNQIVRKTSSGASELVPVVRVTNLARSLKQLQKKGFWVVGAAGESTNGIDSALDSGPLALVMGSEGIGLRRLTREVCDVLVSIPMVGKLESLNVSVATAILLYHYQDRRGKLDASHFCEEGF